MDSLMNLDPQKQTYLIILFIVLILAYFFGSQVQQVFNSLKTILALFIPEYEYIYL